MTAQIIRIVRTEMPAGERAVAWEEPSGEMIVLVDKDLPADEQKTAARTAVRRHRRGLAAFVPVAAFMWWRQIRPSHRPLIAAGTTVGAVAAAAAVVLPGTHPAIQPGHHDRHRPAVAAPPFAHATPRPSPNRPSGDPPPSKAPPPPSGGLMPRSGVALPRAPSVPSRVELPAVRVNISTPPVSKLPDPSGPITEPVTGPRPCRINLPHLLPHGILCGRLFR